MTSDLRKILETKPYYRYAVDVVSGREIAGELIKLACRRFLEDLNRDDLVFKWKKVDHVIKFASCLKHYEGKVAGKHIEWLPWQCWLVANLYGFYWKETNTRRFNSAYIQVARKNTKDETSVILTLYSLIAEGEAAPQVIYSANSADQAKIAFRFAMEFSKQLDPSKKQLKVLRNEIKFKKNGGILKTVASDTSKLDGWNPSVYVCDEIHEAADDRMIEVLKSGTAARKNPLGICITTAGFNLESPAKKMRDVGVEVLRGAMTDDTYFYAIYEPDPEDDLESIEVMAKANPMLGHSVSEDFLLARLQEMKNNPSKEVFVKTKNFNVWCQSSDVWIPENKLTPVLSEVPDEFFTEDEDLEVVVGLDLAATGDLTCMTLMTAKDGKFVVKNYYYLPESALDGKYNKQLYRTWSNLGFLTLTPGNVCDYGRIRADLNELRKKGARITAIYYDTWNSSQLIIDLTEDGFYCVPVTQTMANLSPATKTLERGILSEMITIDANPVTTWCFANVVLKSDWNENVKATKNSYQAKIDGVVAIVMALGGWYKTPHYSGEVAVIV